MFLLRIISSCFVFHKKRSSLTSKTSTTTHLNLRKSARSRSLRISASDNKSYDSKLTIRMTRRLRTRLLVEMEMINSKLIRQLVRTVDLFLLVTYVIYAEGSFPHFEFRNEEMSLIFDNYSLSRLYSISQTSLFLWTFLYLEYLSISNITEI